MTGYLYNVYRDGENELYWSEKELNSEKIRSEYIAFEEDIFSDENDFEEWWNNIYPIKIERIFLEEIYV